MTLFHYFLKIVFFPAKILLPWFLYEVVNENPCACVDDQIKKGTEKDVGVNKRIEIIEFPVPLPERE